MKKLFLSGLAIGILSAASTDTISVKAGWNLLGTSCEMTLEQMLQTFRSDCISKVFAYTPENGYMKFDPTASINQLNHIDPHMGFWVKAIRDCEITFNSCDNQATAPFEIKGVIIDANTNQAIGGATITVKDSNGNVIYTTQSDNSGNFEIPLTEAGNYTLTIEKDGYIPAVADAVVDENNTIVNLGQIRLVSSDTAAIVNLSGKIIDAVNGNPIANAYIEVYPGLNNTTGTVIETTYTDDNGNFSLSLQSGNYTLVIIKDGYITATYNITLDNSDITQEFTLSPQLATNEEARITLTWGEEPRDLDSHLAYVNNNEIVYHIYWSNMTAYDSSYNIIAQLDRDDITSYGPETITINSLSNEGTYKYYVHDYSDRWSDYSMNLANSGATVKVYFRDRQYTFHVPYEDGTVWKVFEIQNGQLIPCEENCMFYTTSSSSEDFGMRTYNVDKYIIQSSIKEKK